MTGRPTKYSDELLEEAEYYRDNYSELGDMMPSIAGLACHLGIHRVTCHAWAKEEDKTPFSYILNQILDKQERVLFNNGLSGEFNSAIVKLALGKHGYSDKAENTIVGDADKPIKHTIEIIDVVDGKVTDT